MIRTIAMFEDSTTFTVVGRIICEDDSGNGIRKVVLLDAYGNELPVDQPQGCPSRFEFLTEPINRGLLPLWIEPVDCADQVTPRDVTGPIFTTARGEGPRVLMPCSATLPTENPDCDEAVRAAVELRNQLISECRHCEHLGAVIRDLETQASWVWGFTILVGIGLLFALGFGIGWLAGILSILLAALIIWLNALYVEIGRNKGLLEQCGIQVRNTRHNLDEARRLATGVCCPGTINQAIDTPC